MEFDQSLEASLNAMAVWGGVQITGRKLSKVHKAGLALVCSRSGNQICWLEQRKSEYWRQRQ